VSQLQLERSAKEQQRRAGIVMDAPSDQSPGQGSQVVRNVIFDLGGVVLEWNPDQILSRFQKDPDLRSRLRQALFGHADWHQFDRGHLTEDEVIDRMEARIGRPRDELIAIVDAVRESLIEKPDTLKLIRELHQRAIPLYCLSNMPASIYAHLRIRHAFWDVFRGIVISGEVRMVKPEPQVFAHLLERFDLRAAESIFIDDLPVNIEAARRVGLRTILFRDAAQCRHELGTLLTI
jgi:putative hydrolase of the HAD superfamily